MPIKPGSFEWSVQKARKELFPERKVVSDVDRALRFHQLCQTTKGIHISYTYHADLPRKRGGKRVFHQQFVNTREFAMWWAAFQHLVVIGGETWPRQWARTQDTTRFTPHPNALGARRI